MEYRRYVEQPCLWCDPYISRPKDFGINFKRGKVMEIQIKWEPKTEGGSCTNFLASKISFFITLEYFWLASKVKLKIIKVKHQIFFLIGNSQAEKIKIFKGL